jgi:hypothetical protein
MSLPSGPMRPLPSRQLPDRGGNSDVFTLEGTTSGWMYSGKLSLQPSGVSARVRA